ncbi:hypothetical protein ACTXT7_011044 [Hymenolepis weldensis]
MNLTHYMESSMSEIVPPRLLSNSTVPMEQSVPKSCEQMEACLPQKSKFSTEIKCSKCLSQRNHIRAKPMLVCRPKRLALMDDKCKQPEEIGLAKPVYNSKETVSKVIAQNASDSRQMFALISSQDPLTCLQIKVSLTFVAALIFPFDIPRQNSTPTMSHFGVQITVWYHKHLRSRCAAISSQLKRILWRPIRTPCDLLRLGIPKLGRPSPVITRSLPRMLQKTSKRFQANPKL